MHLGVFTAYFGRFISLCWFTKCIFVRREVELNQAMAVCLIRTIETAETGCVVSAAIGTMFSRQHLPANPARNVFEPENLNQHN